jgi:hypothetical protein
MEAVSLADVPDLSTGRCVPGNSHLPPEAWHAVHASHQKLAIAECGCCPVLADCRAWAIGHASSDPGVIGGLTRDQRRAAWRKLPHVNGSGAVFLSSVPELLARLRADDLAAVRQAVFDDQRSQLTQPGPPPGRRAYAGPATAMAAAPGPAASVALAPTHARAVAAAASAPVPVVVAVSAAEPARGGERACDCGCGGTFPLPRSQDRRYATEAHRQRAYKRRRRGLPQADPEPGRCGCGCGQVLPPGKPRAVRKYVSDVCRHRVERAVARARTAAAAASASPPVVVAGTCTAAVTELVTGTSSAGEAGRVLVTVGLQAAS